MTGTAFPAGIKLQEFEIRQDENKATSESLFTRQRQVVTLSGGTADRWVGRLTTEPLDFSRAKPFMAWLATVGEYGRFNIGDPMYTGASTGQTGCLVNGASQTGSSLTVDGLTPSVLAISAGEYFQVRDEYKVVKADVTANGSGQATITFWPALRVSPADNDPVTFNTPKLVADVLPPLPAKAPSPNRLHVFSIAFQEALITS